MGVLAGGFLVASLGFAADEAKAAYKFKVEAGTLKITGDAASDKLVLRLQPGSPTTLQVDVGADGTADFSVDRSTFTAIDVEARGGGDEVRVDQSAGAFFDEALTMDGGGGADTLRGGSGAEILTGGVGDDIVVGGDGNDKALLGGGADTFVWNPGDDNDVVEGEGGSDRIDFNGSIVSESIELSANGSRARLTRNIANIVMDIDDVERVAVHAFGGADTIVVNDLAGTGVKNADADLHGPGGAGVDGQPDTVTARGTDGVDRVTLSSPGGYEIVSGLAAQVLVEGGEPAHDNINVATLGAEDTIITGREVFGPAPFNVDGGAGDDVVRYDGTDTDDQIDVVSNGTEVSTVAPLAARLDTTAVESLVLRGLGGADTITGTGNLAPLTVLTFDGGEGNDTLRGGNGPDLLLGGGDDDEVDGNQGQDRAFLGSGEDRFQWDPGDGNDTVEGDGGFDQLDFNGSAASENVEVSANGSRARLTRNIASIVIDLNAIERVAFHAFGGADAVVVQDLAGTGVRNADVYLRAPDGMGDGQPDTVTAVATEGPDRLSLSSPGGYEIVSGLAAQVLVEGGEAANDNVNVAALGGEDTITTGREVFGPAPFNVDGGDGADVTRYNGTDVADAIDVFSNGTEVSTVAPLAARLDTTAVESLVVLGLGGADTITATGNLAPLTALTFDGGEDGDTLRGGNGPDLLLGGGGDDLADGNQGQDRALLGEGDDRFQWDPGDGNDTVEGQSGADALDFNGSSASESVAVSANGRRAQVTRNIANITMDLDDVEGIVVYARGGSDTILVDDLRGTDVATVDADLSALGIGDAQPDTVIVNGTNRRDAVEVTRSALQVLVSGLAAQTRIVGGEPAMDTLRVQTLDGDDEVTVAPDVSELITPVVDLGPDE